MGFEDGFFLTCHTICRNILQNIRKQIIEEPFQQKLWRNVGKIFNQPIPSTTFLDVIRDIGGFILLKIQKYLYDDIVTNRRLEVVEKEQNNIIESFICIIR